MKKIITISALILFLSTYSSGQIINVPGDQPTIQAAINSSTDGDTVLVADGLYYENINFSGKAITVASWFLVDGDEMHIDSTIINGSQPSHPDSGVVVEFNSGEDTTSVLYGFTITGGTGGSDPYGYGTKGAGGIGINNSGAKIQYNKITGNIVSDNSSAEGGGIIVNANSNYVLILDNYITDNRLVTSISNDLGGGGIFLYKSLNGVTIANNVISNNIVVSTNGNPTGYGGGIYLENSVAQIRNNLIVNNKAKYGGGIGLENNPLSTKPIIVNNTIVNNEAETIGGIYNYGQKHKILNSIIWGNIDPNNKQISDNLIAEYCDIEGGFIGTGNIDQDPLFADTINYYLSSGSPCVDAGDPDSHYNDVDDPNNPGSPLFPALGELRNDMGCYGGKNEFESPTDVKLDDILVLRRYELMQNYPNPFNPTTTIKYSIPLVEFGFVPTTQLAIYDILGREVEILINKKHNPGNYEVTWDARNFASGVYFCKLQVGSFIKTKKMILLR